MRKILLFSAMVVFIGCTKSKNNCKTCTTYVWSGNSVGTFYWKGVSDTIVCDDVNREYKTSTLMVNCK